MSSSQPRFSIVIPCYNEALYIGNALRSLKSQKFSGRFEIIVVDNNSTDQTAKIALKNGARVISEIHPGTCWARQAGAKAAKGEIIISTDADTVFRSNWLQKIDDSFKKNPRAVAVSGPCAYFDGPWWGKIYPKILFGAVNLVYHPLGRPFYVTATNIAFKKSAWSGYDTTLTQGGDELDLLHKLAKKGKVLFDNKNVSLTSARRLQKGLFYNLFVSFLVYYLLAYYLNKLFKRTILGTAPAYRENNKLMRTKQLFPRFALVSLAVVVLAWTSIFSGMTHWAFNIVHAAGHLLKKLI
ncbi:MAG TPA: glycosyltransferase family 2 protein [Candidatus Dormibacteraeota bacterium]|nr:glycosyltransferase family 2 protein [Candidatus Dormibacteraeota bacterium]